MLFLVVVPAYCHQSPPVDDHHHHYHLRRPFDTWIIERRTRNDLQYFLVVQHHCRHCQYRECQCYHHRRDWKVFVAVGKVRVAAPQFSEWFLRGITSAMWILLLLVPPPPPPEPYCHRRRHHHPPSHAPHPSRWKYSRHPDTRRVRKGLDSNGMFPLAAAVVAPPPPLESWPVATVLVAGLAVRAAANVADCWAILAAAIPRASVGSAADAVVLGSPPFPFDIAGQIPAAPRVPLGGVGSSVSFSWCDCCCCGKKKKQEKCAGGNPLRCRPSDRPEMLRKWKWEALLSLWKTTC
mmetsp:Transcript_18799/g.51486  ORF Transcript_18799/g.51486 Transcript_18799/m.51486 type:complete len:294 (+) Transcript_18799:2426-3307(+)